MDLSGALCYSLRGVFSIGGNTVVSFCAFAELENVSNQYHFRSRPYCLVTSYLGWVLSPSFFHLVFRLFR